MSSTETKVRHGIMPRLLRRERAAGYLDISPGSFDKLVRDGKLPPPKVHHSFKEWDRLDLDAYVDSLPYAGESAQSSTWDD